MYDSYKIGGVSEGVLHPGNTTTKESIHVSKVSPISYVDDTLSVSRSNE